MKEALQIFQEENRLRLQVRSLSMFDLSVFARSGSSELFLECSGQNPARGLVEYDIQNRICLADFLKQVNLNKPEACSFLFSLFSPLTEALKNQPVVLDLKTIFLDSRGEEILLIRAPLILEAWMKRQPEIKNFILDLMHSLSCDSLEIFGLLWKAVQEGRTLEDLLEEIEEMYQSCSRYSFFGRRHPVPRYRSKKAVFAQMESSPLTLPQEKEIGKPCLGQADPEREKDIRPAEESIQTAPSFGPAIPDLFEKEPDEQTGILFTPAQRRQVRRDHLESWDPFQESEEPVKTDQEEPFLFRQRKQMQEDSEFFQTAPDFSARKTCREAKTGFYPEQNQTVLLEELLPSACLEIDHQKFVLEGETVLIGRDQECPVRIADLSVSACHARLSCQNGRWYLQDLKSTNGTWLDEKRVIRRMRLKEGMVIRFGSRKAVFHEQPVSHH